VSGAWVFKGTRLPVATVTENLEDLSIDEVIEQFDPTREQLTAVFELVPDCLRFEVPPVLVLFDPGTPKGLTGAHNRSHGAVQGVGRAQQWGAVECCRRCGLRAGADNRQAHPLLATTKRDAVVVLTGSTKWSRLRQHTARIAAAVAAAAPGSYAEVDIPFEPKPRRS
jgi:Protein of unknown function (DUF433)